jgi:CBS domain-containing protein
MARVGDVMNVRVVSVRPDESVHVAIARMLEEGVGSVAVCDHDTLVGIFTERDVLRLAGHGPNLAEVEVGAVMTRAVVTVSPDDDAIAAAGLMAERRIRHLPVVHEGHVLGILGIRDVVRSLLEVVWRSHDPAARDTARELLSRGVGARDSRASELSSEAATGV